MNQEKPIFNKEFESFAQPFKDPIITVKNLTIYRGRDKEDCFILKIPELNIPSGKIVAIVGTSGCGKSSLLTVLGLMRGSQKDQECFIECKELSFMFKGENYIVYKDLNIVEGADFCINRDKLERLRQEAIGFCLQGGELIPSLSLEENVAVTGFLEKNDKSLSLARDYLKRLKMDDLLASFPNQLSGGQRQRGIVARALVHRPAMIILDEPTSSLDRSTAEKTLKLLKECTSEGQTVLMVTHDRVLAEDFADIIIEMEIHKGKRSASIVNIQDKKRDLHDDSKEEAKCLSLSDAHSWDQEKISLLHEPWFYYFRLGFMDALGPLYRIFSKKKDEDSPPKGRFCLNSLISIKNYYFTFQLFKNAVVLVAIGLLILILMGMRSGLIEQFRLDLTKSPSGRRLILTPKMRRHGLTLKNIEDLKQKYTDLEMIIPVTKDVVFLKKKAKDKHALTLYGTLSSDPMLSMVYSNQDFTTMNVDSIVLSKGLANLLKLGVSDSLQIWVSRFIDAEGKEIELMPANLKVSHIIDSEDTRTAYIHLDFSHQIAEYKNGYPVPERNWPGFSTPISPRYSSFLLVTKKTISPREENMLLMRGLIAKPVEMEDPKRSLFGWLKDEKTLKDENLPNLFFWDIQSERQDEDYRWLDPRIIEVESQLIDCDGIMLPWNDPLEGELDGEKVLLVGLSGRLRWLRRYLKPELALFSLQHDGWIATFDNLDKSIKEQNLRINFKDRLLELKISVYHKEQDITDNTDLDITDNILQNFLNNTFKHTTENILIDPNLKKIVSPRILAIPSMFLSRLHMVGEGLAEPDMQQQMIRSVQEEKEFYQIRAYARDVYQVDQLHKDLIKEFGVQSNASRVAEIKKYANTLDLIVGVISIFAIIIAFFTALLVFKEVGENKKRMMSTLRIMGLTSRGVYVLMIVRSILVALIASLLLLVLGITGTFVLNRFYNTSMCLLSLLDYLIVISCVIGTCIIGVLYPAWILAKTDPVVAFEEATKFA